MKTEDFSQTIDLIHRTPLEPELWPLALQQISDLLGTSMSGLLVRDLRAAAIPVALIDPRSPAPALAAYAEYYAGIDVLAREAQRYEAGEVITDEVLTAKREIVRSEVWNDFYVKWSLDRSIGTYPVNDPDLTASLIVYRDNHQPFGAEEIHTMRMLAPHVRTAVRCWMRIREADGRAASRGDALESLAAGIILLDRSGRAVWMNRTAREVVARRDPLVASGGELVARFPGETAQLRRLVREALAGGGDPRSQGHMLLTPAGNRRPISVLVTRVVSDAVDTGGAHEAMLVLEPEAASVTGYLKETWGLTTAEAALACAIAEGKSLQDVSIDREVTVATLRSQLKRVLQKTGAHTQAQLVQLILTSPAAMVRS